MAGAGHISSLEGLREVMGAYTQTRVLQVAHHIGVFEALADGEKDAEALAKVCATGAEELRGLLTACCAMGLVTRDGDTFGLTPISREHLVSTAPLYQGNMISHGMGVWDRWNELPRRFRPGEGTEPARSCTSPKRARRGGDGRWGGGAVRQVQTAEPGQRDFILAMHNITVTGRGAHLAEVVDLSGRRNLVDIGGGPGTYSVFLCRANPELRATIWDLPETIAIARECVARAEDVQDRISFIEGDWDKDDFGEGWDAMLMSNVMHGWPSEPVMKLEKARRALVPGGKLIIQDFILDNDRRGPLAAALFNVYIGGFTYAELAELMTQHGFESPEVVYAPEDDSDRHGVIAATRAG